VRLIAPAGTTSISTSLPERLVHLQECMAAADPRAAPVYRTVGSYPGYGC
jgi:hypothetical protein